MKVNPTDHPPGGCASRHIRTRPFIKQRLRLLHTHRNKVIDRDTLLDQVWGLQYFGTTRTVDQTVAQVRKKLGTKDAAHLKTVHGAGYQLPG